MKKINLSPNRLTRFYSFPFLILTLFALLLSTTAIAYQAPNADVGYVDFSFGLTTANDPTGEKPESKLWWNDGFWWGSLFETTSNTYHIYRLNWGSQTWEDTGVQLDDRPTTRPTPCGIRPIKSCMSPPTSLKTRPPSAATPTTPAVSIATATTKTAAPIPSTTASPSPST